MSKRARSSIPQFRVRVPTKHRLAQRRQAGIEEFAEERILLSPLGFAMHNLFEQACEVFNIRPRVVFECPNVNTLIVLAAANQEIRHCSVHCRFWKSAA
jgi:DNA-binding transcriptional LysR family regulator